MIETVEYQIVYRRSKSEPQVTETRTTAEAAYRLAIEIETNGGITLVTPVKKVIPELPQTKLYFED